MSTEVDGISAEVATTQANPTVNVPELDVSELARTSSDVLLNEISRNCVAVKLSVSAMGYERTIRNASVTVDEQAVPDELLAGAKFKLMPASIKNPLMRIAGIARGIPASYGTPFVGGAYLVPLSRQKDGRCTAQVVFDRIGQLREDYRLKAEELRPAWEAHVSNVRTSWPEAYEKLERCLVSGEDFVRAHNISTILFPLGAGLPADFDDKLSAGFRDLMNSSTLSDAEKEVLVRLKDHVREVVDRAAYNVGSVLDSDRSAAWVNEAQQATSAAVAEAVRAMVQEPMTEFANAMANVEGILSRGGALRASTMDNLKRAYQKLQGFSFMAPDDLQRRLTAVGSVIESLDFKEVNSSESASRALANHFAEVREQVTSEETHVAVYGRFRRSISL
jgi:hypothetical protein